MLGEQEENICLEVCWVSQEQLQCMNPSGEHFYHLLQSGFLWFCYQSRFLKLDLVGGVSNSSS